MIDIQKSVMFLLRQQYLSEFEVIDELSQHPKGLTFNDWLIINEVVIKETNLGGKSIIHKRD